MSEIRTETKYFHEDDYCQVEILPLENWAYCAKELGLIADFSGKHLAPDGGGWTKMYMRGDSQVPTVSKQISFEAAVRAVICHIPKYDSVTTGTPRISKAVRTSPPSGTLRGRRFL